MPTTGNVRRYGRQNDGRIAGGRGHDSSGLIRFHAKAPWFTVVLMLYNFLPMLVLMLIANCLPSTIYQSQLETSARLGDAVIASLESGYRCEQQAIVESDETVNEQLVQLAGVRASYDDAFRTYRDFLAAWTAAENARLANNPRTQELVSFTQDALLAATYAQEELANPDLSPWAWACYRGAP